MQMIIRRKDNSRIPKSVLAGIAALTDKIADKSFEQLESEGVMVFPARVRDYTDITSEQMILQSANDEYVLGNVMGFVGCGTDRLVIESRFDSESNDYFLLYLLGKVLNFPNIVDLQTDADSENQLFNWLVFLFPYYLQKAARKGFFKTYIHREYNDANIKATIDVARHIRQNTPFVGKIAYSQREYSADNNIIELVRHTIEFIKKKPYGHNLLVKVKDEVDLVVDATPRYRQCDRQKIVSQNKQHPIRHAYYHEYRALQRLCILILQYQKHQIGSGMRQIYGILFDGAWLWEEYVNTLIKDYFVHPSNKSGVGAQHLFNGNSKGLIYPDFIGKAPHSHVIADAKYKPIDNIGNRDYLQVLAYMFRFDANRGYYLYPEKNGLNDEILWLNKGCTYERNVTPRDDICVIKHGLKIPLNADCYEDFVAIMQVNEIEFIKSFSMLI
ncbi:MAG: hypothetical protein J1F66_01335 [Clostridiales bacterium]|nr:hypothetical protein [Clostridiales bacterium]